MVRVIIISSRVTLAESVSAVLKYTVLAMIYLSAVVSGGFYSLVLRMHEFGLGSKTEVLVPSSVLRKIHLDF